MARYSRRSLLTGCGAVIASAPLSARLALAQTAQDTFVIDGNLVADLLTKDAVISQSIASEVRNSGLTAFKQSLGGSGENFSDASIEIAETKKAILRNAALFTQVEQASDFRALKNSGRVGIILSFEAASMFEGKVDQIDHFRSLGVRVMGLSYNKGSPFGSGILPTSSRGLTELGRQAVERMNHVGVTIDLSHSDEPTSFEAVSTSNRPLAVTHAGCAAVHPHPRNKSDALLRAVANKGGVVGIFELSFLGNYPENPTVDIYMNHLLHALNVCGEEHVGIGSDTNLLAVDTSPSFVADWAKNEAVRKAAGVLTPEEGPLPFVQGLNGPFRWRKIADQLRQRGYSSRTVDRVMGMNFYRVFKETW